MVSIIKNKVKKHLKKFIKRDLRDLYWAIYGSFVENPRWPNHVSSFLFVCKGNICRSPFAEHLTRKKIGSTIGRKASFYSAGLEVSHPVPPPKDAISAAESFGIHLNGHRSRRLSPKMVESFDILIAMEAWQFQALRKTFPQHSDKVFLLPLFDSKGRRKHRGFARFNIQDPYGKKLDEFHSCFQRIASCIEMLLEKM